MRQQLELFAEASSPAFSLLLPDGAEAFIPFVAADFGAAGVYQSVEVPSVTRTVTLVAVPEPASVGLFAVSLVGLAGFRRVVTRRKGAERTWT